MALDAGKLNRRVTIQSRSEPLDGYGDAKAVWSTVDTVWAHVQPMSGTEKAEAQSFGADVSMQVTIRYRDDVTPKNRLLLGSRVLEIVSARDEDERHEALVLVCSERAA